MSSLPCLFRLLGEPFASSGCPAGTGCRRLLTALCVKYVSKFGAGNSAKVRSARALRLLSASRSSTDQAVGAVRVLHEVLGVAARIPAPVLWEEHAVRMIGPPRTRATHILRAETLRQDTR